MYLEEQLCSFWLSSVELWIDIDSKSSEIVDKSSSSVKEKKKCISGNFTSGNHVSGNPVKVHIMQRDHIRFAKSSFYF